MSLLDTASLIVTPNAYKEGKLYSVIPSDGSGDLSVTRATTATRVNSAGLVELVPYNLLTYSEQFNNAAWSKTASSVTANATTAPNGTLTADKLIEDSANNQHRLDQTTTSVIGTNTFTVYAKKAERDSVWLRVGTSGAYFDLTNGTISGSSGVTASIESLPDGWYRCTIVRTSTVANEIVRINLAIGTNGSYTGTIGNGLFIWGAQLVEGTSALDYQMTETRLNIPRLDYSLGSCPSILVEPQRTNLMLRSEEFDNASWVKTNTTITANSSTSPDGTSTADILVENSTSNDVFGVHANPRPSGLTLTTTYSVSFFAKKITRDFCYYHDFNGFQNPIVKVFFNLQTGLVGNTSAGVLNPKMENYGNGWYRCSFQFVATSVSGTQIDYRIASATTDNVSTYTGVIGQQAIAIWGAQFETGAYPTSYIPTTSASVTRNVDITTEKNITSFGIGNSYTLLFDLQMEKTDSNKILFNLKTSAGVLSFTLRNFNNTLRLYDAIGATYPLTTDPQTNGSKWAIRINGTSYTLFRVLGGVVTKNTATLGTARNIGYFSEMNSGQTKASIKLIAIEPSALTDAECEQFVMS
jgi:hypothetical protein